MIRHRGEPVCSLLLRVYPDCEIYFEQTRRSALTVLNFPGKNIFRNGIEMIFFRTP